MLFAKVDHSLVNGRVGAVRYDRQSVLGVACGVPHFTALPDHGRHGGVDNDIAGHVKIGNALVRVDHGQGRTRGERGLQIFLQSASFLRGQLGQLRHQVPETVVEIDSELVERRSVFADEVREIDPHRVPENDRIRHLHHRRLEVQGEKDAEVAGGLDLLFQEGNQRPLAHESRVENLAFRQFEAFLQKNGRPTVCREKFDARGRGCRHRDGLFVREKIAAIHRRHARFRVGRPGAHLVRVLARVVLHRLRGAAVGVSFAQHGIDRAPLHCVIAFLGLSFRIIPRRIRIIGQGKTLLLQFGDGRFELRDRSADVRQLDDVGLGLQRERAEFRECIGRLLRCRQAIGKSSKNPSGQRNVPEFNVDSRIFGEGLDDRQKGISREQRGFVGLGVNDGRLGRHKKPAIKAWLGSGSKQRRSGFRRRGIQPP